MYVRIELISACRISAKSTATSEGSGNSYPLLFGGKEPYVTPFMKNFLSPTIKNFPTVLAFSIPVSDELVHKDSCLGCISAFAVPVLGMRTPDQRYPKYLIGMQSRCSIVSISCADKIRWYFPTESVKTGFTTLR